MMFSSSDLTLTSSSFSELEEFQPPYVEGKLVKVGAGLKVDCFTDSFLAALFRVGFRNFAVADWCDDVDFC